jgi:quercetin dioxygenase-like cupin family protein
MSDPEITDADSPQVRPVDLRDWVDFDRDTARQVRVFETEQMALDLWCIEPQQATPPLHEPSADLAYTILGGRSWFVTDDGEIGLDPLGSMLIPAGIVHGIDNRGADPLIVAVSSSPPSTRPEFTDPTDDRGEAVRAEPHRPGPLRRLVRTVIGD